MKLHCKLLLIIPLCLLLLCSARSTDYLEKVVIDTDAGSDDALAILLTLKAQEKKGFKVVAITCTYGNTDVENVVANVLKTLTIANAPHIPVYKGAERALVNHYKSDHFFGSDGFGDFNFTQKITAKLDDTKHAAVALVDLVNKYPNEITLLNIGPLTNVATASALDPSFLERLKSHVILGGSVAGLGNILPNVEFNFYQDPEANYMVLNRTRKAVLLPWETVTNTITVKWRKFVLGAMDCIVVDFLNKAERISLSKTSTWGVSDGMAAAAMLWPELVTKSIVTNVSPVTDGLARGSILVDYTNLTSRPKNIEIVQSINTTAFKQHLLSGLC